MTAHVGNVCPAAVVPCKYEHVGCDVKVREQEPYPFLCVVIRHRMSKDAIDDI